MKSGPATPDPSLLITKLLIPSRLNPQHFLRVLQSHQQRPGGHRAGQWPPPGVPKRGCDGAKLSAGDYDEVSDLPALGGREEESGGRGGMNRKEKVGGGHVQ